MAPTASARISSATPGRVSASVGHPGKTLRLSPASTSNGDWGIIPAKEELAGTPSGEAFLSTLNTISSPSNGEDNPDGRLRNSRPFFIPKTRPSIF